MPPTSDDEYDNFPDDFEDIDLSNVPGLAYDDAVATIPAQPSPRPQPLDEALPAPVAAAATPSDHYSFDELDDTFLAEVDELDQLLTQEVARTQPVEETPAATQPVSANTNAEAGSSLYAASSSASIEEVDKELGELQCDAVAPFINPSTYGCRLDERWASAGHISVFRESFRCRGPSKSS
ncbi:hypothetical protein EWM64_g274 [Hericium alpestre]|uniref:Uncharacterized protein n=1 Tax=Hericium alpestre TaxID=135208 RepID=A0A4Z0ABK6_9AGAM|nr:hypothetical protein EWM64_g274 [Hericium alpestre]